MFYLVRPILYSIVHYTFVLYIKYLKDLLFHTPNSIEPERASRLERECKGNTLFLFRNTLVFFLAPSDSEPFHISVKPAGLPSFANAKVLPFIPYIQIFTKKIVLKRTYTL